MNRTVYHVDVGRVIVSGVATAAQTDRAALQALVEQAVGQRLARAAVPGAPAVATAVATQVVRAATGGSRRG